MDRYEYFKSAVLQAVMSWPMEKHRPNCVRVANAVTDLVDPPTYEDYLQGNFFARDWIGSGAVPSDIRLERPMVVVERDMINVPSPYSKNGCVETWITVIDTLCDGCTAEATISRIIATTHRLLLRVGAYALYTNGADFVLSPVPVAGYHKKLDRFVEDEPIKIIPNPRLVQDSGFAASVKLTICGCIASDEVFEQFNKPRGMGEPICETC